MPKHSGLLGTPCAVSIAGHTLCCLPATSWMLGTPSTSPSRDLHLHCSPSAPACSFSTELRPLPSASLQPQQPFLLQKNTTNHRTQNKNPTRIYRSKWHRLKTSVFADAQSQVSREFKAPHLLIPHTSKLIHSQPVNATSVLIFCKQTDCFWLKFLSFFHHKQNSHMLLFLSCYLVISL